MQAQKCNGSFKHLVSLRCYHTYHQWIGSQMKVYSFSEKYILQYIRLKPVYINQNALAGIVNRLIQPLTLFLTRLN